jgi:hypothetical protein
MSLVDVSWSTLTLLNVSSTLSLSAFRRVEDEEPEHRRHVGRDHARALGDAAEAERLVLADRDLDDDLLGDRVGRHDALGRGARFVVLEERGGAADPELDLVHRKHLADDAGGRHEDLLGPDPQELRRDLLHAARVLEPLLARAGVRAAGIGDDGTRDARLDGLAADGDRRRDDRVLREDARAAGRLLRVDHRDVPSALLERRVEPGGLEALHVEQVRVMQDLQWRLLVDKRGHRRGGALWGHLSHHFFGCEVHVAA